MGICKDSLRVTGTRFSKNFLRVTGAQFFSFNQVRSLCVACKNFLRVPGTIICEHMQRLNFEQR